MQLETNPSSRLAVAAIAALALCSPLTVKAYAAESATMTQKESKDLGDELKDLGLLYKDKHNPYLQEFWVLGRYHLHYHDTNTSNGEDSRWESRRIRYGFQATLFQNLTIHAQAIAASDFDDPNDGFSELWARWKFSDLLSLTVGQQKNRFSLERNVSSRYMNYFERSMFINSMGLDYTPAVTISGHRGNFEYITGIFSNATDANMIDSFTELDSGFSYIFTGIQKLQPFWGLDTAEFHGSYIHSEFDKTKALDYPLMTRYDDGVSLALATTKDSASLVSEVTAGIGGDHGNGIGLNIQPGYFITDKLQIVGRYQLAMSNEEDGLKAQKRYESISGLPNGELYQAYYVGLNYYIADHRLKLLTGVEYATMDDEEALTFCAGIRMFFGPHSNAPFPGNKMLPGHW